MSVMKTAALSTVAGSRFVAWNHMLGVQPEPIFGFQVN